MSKTNSSITIASAVSNFKEITKIRLAVSVVFSSLAGYLLGADTVNLKTLLLLAIGGYCMVGASNAYNQIIERDLDALMDRTKNRPVPAGRMSVNTAFVIASILTILGIVILYTINPQTAMFGAISIFLYTSVLYASKNKNTFVCFCWSDSRRDSFYARMGSCHK